MCGSLIWDGHIGCPCPWRVIAKGRSLPASCSSFALPEVTWQVKAEPRSTPDVQRAGSSSSPGARAHPSIRVCELTHCTEPRQRQATAGGLQSGAAAFVKSWTWFQSSSLDFSSRSSFHNGWEKWKHCLHTPSCLPHTHHTHLPPPSPPPPLLCAILNLALTDPPHGGNCSSFWSGFSWDLDSRAARSYSDLPGLIVCCWVRWQVCMETVYRESIPICTSSSHTGRNL
jgi:hypothetical protein